MTDRRRVRSVPPGSPNYKDKVSEFIETASGVRGKKSDAMMTRAEVEDLIFAGIGVRKPLNVGTRNQSRTGAPASDVYPTMPGGVTAKIRSQGITIIWDAAVYDHHSRTEIWRSPVREIAYATMIGQTSGTQYEDVNAGADQTWTYHVRHVAAEIAGGARGPFAPGVTAVSAIDPIPAITSQLDRLDGPAEMPGSVLQLVDTERQQRETNESFNAALQAVLSRAHDAQRAAVQSFEVVRATTTEALTQQITLAVSRINNNESAIYNESLTRATETGSLASQVALLQAKVDARPVFASGWEPGLDYDRWSVSTGTLTPETTDVFTGLQSGLLNGTISAPVSSGTADGFAGRDVRLVVQVKAAPGDALEISYSVGSYSSGWQPIAVSADWSEQAVTLTVPAETAGNAGTVSVRTTAGSVLVDRLILENADSDLPVITAEIERISNAQADLEGAVASELAALEAQFNDSLALVQQTAESKVSETEALAIANSAIQAKGYDTALAGIVSEQSALANEQTAQSTRLDALAAGTGLGEAGISERGVSLATDIELSAIVENVISAASKAGAASFTSLKEVVVTKDAARAVSQEQQAVQLNDLSADYTEYKRSAIGYCVDANGNPTNHADAVSCELVLGNRWVTAPLAEALTQARITLPSGQTAQAGLLLQSLSDGVDELTARAALAIDVNGRVSGLFLEGSETASALDIVVDSFRIKTAGGSKTPFEVVGSDVYLRNAILETEMRIGKTSYADTGSGVWMGLDAGNAKMSIGNSSSHVKWDGSQLYISGVIDAVTFRSADRKVKSELNNTYGRASAFLYSAEVYADGGSTASEIYLGKFYLPASPVSMNNAKVSSLYSFIEVSGMVSFKNSGWTMEYRRLLADGVHTAWTRLPNAPEILQNWPEHEVRIFPWTFSFPLFSAEYSGGIAWGSDLEVEFRLSRTVLYRNPATINSHRVFMKYENF